MRHDDTIEADFFAAHRRLSIGAPLDFELKAKAIAGKLSINLSTLALEAGHSRTLISMRNSRYPRVRGLIFPEEQIGRQLSEQDSVSARGKRSSQTEKITDLRQEKKALQNERDKFATRLAESESAIALLRRENLNLRSTIERLTISQ
jgi:hypothetical protein